MTLQDKWSIKKITNKPLTELLKGNNPFPLYWGGSNSAWPPPTGVPIKSYVYTAASHVFGRWPASGVHGESGLVSKTFIDHDLQSHLDALEDQLTNPEAKPTYVGDTFKEVNYFVFDFESLHISWNRTGQKERENAIESIVQRNPDAVRYMNSQQVEELSKKEWKRRAIELFKESVKIVKKHFPNVKVGYYGLNQIRKTWADAYALDRPELDEWRRENDEGKEFLEVCDLVCPTIYNFYKGGGTDGINYVKLNVGEARRMADEQTAKDGKKREVLPYVWGLYHNSNQEHKFTPVDAEDARASIIGSYEAGADGIILWDSHSLWNRYRDVQFAEFNEKLWQMYSDVYAPHYVELIESLTNNKDISIVKPTNTQ